jgi:hypothetical protein
MVLKKEKVYDSNINRVGMDSRLTCSLLIDKNLLRYLDEQLFKRNY